MNYKFSIKIAALLATLTGTSVGPTSLVPSDWLASASAQPPIISSDQAQPQGNSNMLAPLVPPVRKPGEAMPWKVDASKYRSAINPANQNRPALVQQTPLGQYAEQASLVRQAVGTENDQAESSVQPAAALVKSPIQGQLPSGYSAAGIPLYQSAPSTTRPAPYSIPKPYLAPIAHTASTASSAIAAPQGSGTRGAIGSGFQPSPVLPAPPVISPGSELISGPSSGPIPQTAPGSVLTQGPTLADPSFVGTPVGNSVVTGGSCSTCETGGAVGCESGGGCNCGPGGCFNADEIASRAGLYGSVGEARYYGHLEVLVMDRDDGDILFTPSLQLGGFDADVGYRATFGERFDAINGREFSYWGTGDISNSETLTSDAFPLDQVFQTTDSTRDAITPFGFFTEDSVFSPSTLVRPTEQTQIAETYFHSFEANRVRWAWDVFKSFVGIRYIHVNDSYELNSTVNQPDIGILSSGTYTNVARNNFIGPHIGGEWFYDVGYRLSASVNLKGGIYANINEVDTRLTTDGDVFLDAEAENTTFSSSLELGIHAHYQISPRGRFRAGFNVLHLEDVATVTQNFPAAVFDVDGTAVRAIGRGTGSGASDNDDVTFTGFSFGLEFFR